jgi:hypothetical protein
MVRKIKYKEIRMFNGKTYSKWVKIKAKRVREDYDLTS